MKLNINKFSIIRCIEILILIMLLIAIGILAMARKDYANLQKYKLQCSPDNQSACAKYLFLESWIDVKNESYTTNLDKQDWNYWKNRYIDKIETIDDAYVAIDTMLDSLDDPYTRFLTPDEVNDQNMNISSELSGIGVVISSQDGKIKVEDIIENSPAVANDIKIGDMILKIDDISVSGFDIRKIANMIRGEAGTNVKLLIMRNNKTFTKSITRKKITIKSVHHKMLKNNIAYIRIGTFMSQSAAAEFLNALKETSSARGVVLDLRGNQGGLLQNATFVSNMLLKEGTIVSVHKKGNATETIKVQPSGTHTDKPVVVLTNGLCASACEILAAALQDNDRAYLVGEKTYGKGLIQKIMPLPLHTAVNVTIAKYLTPDGHDIHKQGIKPDYEVKITAADIKAHKDPQLDKAIELLK